MEEQKKITKQDHPRITLLTFFYGLCVISIISLVCLAYVLHLRNKNTNARIDELENTIQVIQSTENTSTNTNV